MAPPGHEVRRGDHGVRADDWRTLSDHSPRQTVVVFLGRTLSEQPPDLAEFPVAVGVGLLRDFHLSYRQPLFPSAADDSRLRDRPRPLIRKAEKSLRTARARVARH